MFPGYSSKNQHMEPAKNKGVDILEPRRSFFLNHGPQTSKLEAYGI